MVSISELVQKQFDVKRAAYAPHKEQYEFLINYLGYEQVKKCIPYSLAQIKNALPNDKYLNNLPISEWDRAAGFVQRGAQYQFIGSQLTFLYRQKGITSFSCSNGVSILKECARMWANEV